MGWSATGIGPRVQSGMVRTDLCSQWGPNKVGEVNLTEGMSKWLYGT